MTKILRVAWHEYRRHVFNKRFLMGLLSVPLVMLVMVGLVFLIFAMENNTTPLGYVDYSGLLADPLPAPAPEKPDKPVPILPFETEAEAGSALAAGEVQAYYVIPADYLSTGKLTVVHMGEVKAPARRQFYDFLSVNLLRDIDPAIAARLTEGAEVVVVSPDGSRSASSQNWFNVFLPMIAGLAFMIVMFSTGGYLMQAVVEEKENRTMEVLITSVSPNQFMAGKIIGDISIGLTQIVLWGAFIAVTVLLGRSSIDFLRGIQISSQTLLLVAVVMFPSFVMVAALMAAVGATVAEAREGQQVIGLISMPVWIPYMLMAVIMENPNSPIAIGLSLFPMTAALTMLIRDGLTILPAWQIALCAVIQVASAVGAIWLAGRAFRLGMLRYGKRLLWREIFVKN
ncbi:MAG: ABC transporter permease [Chloroflexi bacterium]|nr:ABC transporter permease [Chloroflexota bacterium]